MTPNPLLQGILDNPDDDDLRLVYADWLEENGTSESERARGAFIRVQVEAARQIATDPLTGVQAAFVNWEFHRDHWAPRGSPLLALVERGDDLWSQFQKAWEEDLPQWARNRVGYGRGLPCSIISPPGQFLRGAGGLWKRVPIQYLAFTSTRGWMGKLASCPYFNRLWGLELNGCFSGDDDLEELTASPHLKGVRELALAAVDLTARGVQALTRCPGLGRLAILNLNGNRLGLPGIHALARAPFLPHLRSLGLNSDGLNDEAVELLGSLSELAGLLVLTLRGNTLTDRGARALAASSHLGGVRFLRLQHNPIGEAGNRALRQRFGDRVRL